MAQTQLQRGPFFFPLNFFRRLRRRWRRGDREVVAAVNPDCAGKYEAEGGKRRDDGNDNVLDRFFSLITFIVYHGFWRLHGVCVSINRDGYRSAGGAFRRGRLPIQAPDQYGRSESR